jgi:hypothetical protein
MSKHRHLSVRILCLRLSKVSSYLHVSLASLLYRSQLQMGLEQIDAELRHSRLARVG